MGVPQTIATSPDMAKGRHGMCQTLEQGRNLLHDIYHHGKGACFYLFEQMLYSINQRQRGLRERQKALLPLAEQSLFCYLLAT